MILNDVKDRILKLKYFYEKNYIKNYKDYFSFTDLSNLLNLRPFINDSRFTVAKSEQVYTWNNSKWATDRNALPISVVKQEIEKNVCLLMDCSKVNENVNNLAYELENLLQGNVDTHIFFDIKGNNQGFGIHFDGSHNLILQIEGETIFQVYDVFHTGEDINLDNICPIKEFLMNPGDIIFMPAKQYHRALSQTKRLALSFPISTEKTNVFEDRNWLHL